MSRLEETLSGEKLRTGSFHKEPIHAAKLKPDDAESLASVHENHHANISAAMKSIRQLGGTVTGVKHTDYDSLPMLKKKGIATGDLNRSTIHFAHGKRKFKLHVRTAHKLGIEGAEHNKTYELHPDDDASGEEAKDAASEEDAS